jgi:predicted P-loop ATPase
VKASTPPRDRMLRAALRYAQMGWKVFPCKPCSKQPATRHGFKDATTDEAQIREWWERTPDANIGIATGEASGVAVVDEDIRSGGRESIDALQQTHGEFPPTLTAITGGGGRHFYFRKPPGIDLRCGKPAEGVDFKADGGYVLAPPSVHPDGPTYRWLNKRVPIAPSPSWLLTKKTKTKRTAPDAAASKLGHAFERLGWLGKLLDDGKRTVLCPWREQHTIGEDHDSSTVVFPGEFGGFHCSHSHCSERTGPQALRELTRREALGDADKAWQGQLLRTAKGEVRSTFGNVVLILSNDDSYAGKLRLDEMRGATTFDQAEVTDATISAFRVDIERRYAMQSADAEAGRAVQLAASRNGFHPVREYLNSLVWDGTRRLATFARIALDLCTDSHDELEHYCMLFHRWMISAVARPLEPGCKVDTALILQGEQGIGKSTLFRILAGEWFSDTEMGLEKDAMMQLGGVWIYEWAELENVTGRHEMSRIKAFMSSTQDKFRPPFGRHTVTHKRSAVIVGTTNREQFLHDPSGSRRFWVLPVGKINLELFRASREQLLAEAVADFRAGMPYWLTPDEEQYRAELVARFAEVDPWEHDVLAYADKQVHVRVRDILTDVIALSLERRDKRAEMRVGDILKKSGYRSVQGRQDGKVRRFWQRSDKRG